MQKAVVVAIADAHGDLIASPGWMALLSPPFMSHE